MKYVIFCASESYMDENLEPLFWCNDDGTGWSGWGSLETATIFEEYEYATPLVGIGVCWVNLEDAKKLHKLWLES